MQSIYTEERKNIWSKSEDTLHEGAFRVTVVCMEASTPTLGTWYKRKGNFRGGQVGY